MIETKEKNKIDIACNRFKIIKQSQTKKFQKLDVWLDKESNIFYNETQKAEKLYLRYDYGQIIKVDFGINIGTELSHTHFAIVLNQDDTIKTDNITVLPLTSKNGYKRINLGNLINNITSSNKYQNTTYGIITQIKTISKERILMNKKKEICDKNRMDIIKSKLKNYFNIN